jgi:hypothetical protein
MGVVTRELDPASPIWITPSVLGSCLALVLGYTLYTYRKELPLPPGPPGIGPGMAPVPRPVDTSPDNRVYFFFEKVPQLSSWYLFPWKLLARDESFGPIMKNLGIALVLATVLGLAITEVTFITIHTLQKPLAFMENTGAQVASALCLCLLLAVLYYRLRDAALTSILYVLGIAFIMVLGALISSQTQVNVQ